MPVTHPRHSLPRALLVLLAIALTTTACVVVEPGPGPEHDRWCYYHPYRCRDALEAASVVLLGDDDMDLPRNDRRIERDVFRIAQHELEGVRAGRQLEAHLGLTCAEMHVLLVGGDGFVRF